MLKNFSTCSTTRPPSVPKSRNITVSLKKLFPSNCFTLGASFMLYCFRKKDILKHFYLWKYIILWLWERSWMPPPAWVASRCRPRQRWPFHRSKNSSGAPTGGRTCQTRRSPPLVQSKALPIEALWVVPANKEASSWFLQIWRQGCQGWSEGADARPRGPSSDYTLCTMEVRYLMPPPQRVLLPHPFTMEYLFLHGQCLFILLEKNRKKNLPWPKEKVFFARFRVLNFSERSFRTVWRTTEHACWLYVGQQTIIPFLIIGFFSCHFIRSDKAITFGWSLFQLFCAAQNSCL